MGQLLLSNEEEGENDDPSEDYENKDFCFGCLAFKMSASMGSCPSGSWGFRMGFQKRSWTRDPGMGINCTETSVDSLEEDELTKEGTPE